MKPTVTADELSPEELDRLGAVERQLRIVTARARRHAEWLAAHLPNPPVRRVRVRREEPKP
jgi:hypothetical protein